MDDRIITRLSRTAQELRRLILVQSKRAGVGHIGSALSIVEIMATLFGGVLNIPCLGHADRDRFILSKGHASLAMYGAFYLRDWLTQEQLDTYCQDGSWLGVHPDHHLPGVDFSTGSLGMGLSLGVGAALAARLQKSDRRVFVVLSDAELNEGSLWEAVMFAAHHRLSNIIAIIDLNGQQALGYTGDVLSLAPVADKWQTFGWDVQVVDGHDCLALHQVLTGFSTHLPGPPHVVVAKTTFGRGVSYMENRIEWHYRPMSDDLYRQALDECRLTTDEPTGCEK